MTAVPFTSAFPIFESANLEAALRFYRDLLGWTVTYQFPPEGSGEPVQFVSLSLGASQLGIGAGLGGDGPPGRDRRAFTLCVYTPDTDVAVEHLRANGATIASEPEDMPWGERVAFVLDPDGNAILICNES